MKKMLLSLIAITLLSTGTTFAQRRSGNRENVRIESGSHRGGHRGSCAPVGAQAHHGTVTHVVHHGPAVHHAPIVHHPMPVHHRHHVYHERVVVAPAAYSYPCPPPPPPAPVVVVEPSPTTAAISIGALAGAIIGGTIAAAASR